MHISVLEGLNGITVTGGSVTTSRNHENDHESVRRLQKRAREIVRPRLPKNVREAVDALAGHLAAMDAMSSTEAAGVTSASAVPFDLIEALQAPAGTTRVITLAVGILPVAAVIDGLGYTLKHEELFAYWSHIQDVAMKEHDRQLERLRGSA